MALVHASIHTNEVTQVTVAHLHRGIHTLKFGSSACIFSDIETLVRMRDAIDAHLGIYADAAKALPAEAA